MTDDVSSVVNWVRPGRTPISDVLRARLDEESAALFGDRLAAVDALDAETARLRPAGQFPGDLALPGHVAQEGKEKHAHPHHDVLPSAVPSRM